MLPGPARKVLSAGVHDTLYASLIQMCAAATLYQRQGYASASTAGISCSTGWYIGRQTKTLCCFRLGIGKNAQQMRLWVIEHAARHQSGEGSVMTHKGLESGCLSFLASCWTLLCADSAACCSSSSCPLTSTSESES